MALGKTSIAVALASLWTGAVHPQDTSLSAPAASNPQTLSPVLITGAPLGSNLLERVDPVNVLQGRDLRLKQQSTLGQTLEQEVGVSSTYFGPNASRPVIRGLGGFDIRLLNNGIGLLDASASSPDHAVAVSPFAVDRVEVVRGPATVMYGGSAIGGVVNTIDSRIAQQPLERPIYGQASFRVDSQNDLRAGGARLDGGNENFALHVDGYASSNNDLRIPGSAWTSQVQSERGASGPVGTLPNSQADSKTYGLGTTFFIGDRGYLGISYGQFDTNYGTVAEPNVTIDLAQQTWNASGELRDTLPGLSALRFKYAHIDYTHTEFDGADAGTVFDSTGWNLRLEGLHGKIGPFEGAVGVEASNIDFVALGDEAFVPSTKTRSFAGFVYEELHKDAWKFSFGGRVEGVSIDAKEFVAAGLPADSVDFTPWSAAAAALYSPNKQWSVGVNLQYTQRAPSFQELFADGPHIATDQFEVGNRQLDKVTSTSVDLALKRKGEFFTSSVGAFYTRFSNYVGLFPTGIFRNAADRSTAPGPQPYIDPATGEEVTPIEQFNYAQVKARFYGLEAQVAFPVWREELNQLSMKLQGDYVNATDTSNGQPLPFIPPLRIGAALTYEREGLNVTLGSFFAARQTRVPALLTETPGYANVYLNASYRWLFERSSELEVFLQGTNLLDQTIRYSTSNLKDIAPAGGRALMAGIRGAF